MTPDYLFENVPFLSEKLPQEEVILNNIKKLMLERATPEKLENVDKFLQAFLQKQAATDITKKYGMIFELFPHNNPHPALEHFYKYLFLSHNINVLNCIFFDPRQRSKYVTSQLIMDKLLIALHTQDEKILNFVLDSEDFSKYLKNFFVETVDETQKFEWILQQALLDNSKISPLVRAKLLKLILENPFLYQYLKNKCPGIYKFLAYKLLYLYAQKSPILRFFEDYHLFPKYLAGEEVALSDGSRVKASLEELLTILKQAILIRDSTTSNTMLTPQLGAYLQGETIKYDSQNPSCISLEDSKNLFEIALKCRKNYVARILWKNEQLKRDYLGLDTPYPQKSLYDNFYQAIHSTCSEIISDMLNDEYQFFEKIKYFPELDFIGIGAKFGLASYTIDVFNAFLNHVDDIAVLQDICALLSTKKTNAVKIELLIKRIQHLEGNDNIFIPEAAFYGAPSSNALTIVLPTHSKRNRKKKPEDQLENPRASKAHKNQKNNLMIDLSNTISQFDCEPELVSRELNQQEVFRLLNTPIYSPISRERAELTPIQSDVFDDKNDKNNNDTTLDEIEKELSEDLLREQQSQLWEQLGYQAKKNSRKDL